MWIGNTATEKDIRDWLSANGYCGASARFEEIELHAIQRPGWLQIYRFSGRVKTADDNWKMWYGAVRDDQRFRRTEIKIFDTPQQQHSQLESWSDGLITRRRKRK